MKLHPCEHEAHGPGQDHPHDHDGHRHAAGVTDERRIAWAFFLIFSFMIVEVAGGLISGSLALLADAGHMVSDAAALGLSWWAFRLGKRRADARRSYGYKRMETLVAFVNGLALFMITGWIIYEAVRRFAQPAPVLGKTMLMVAIAGLLANIAAFFVLHSGNRENLNLRSAWLHVLGDLLGFMVAIVAAVIIMLTGWFKIDPLLSVLIALLILKSAAGIIKSSGHILLEGSPSGIDEAALKQDLLENVADLAEVHHIHTWSLTGEQALVTMHVRAKPGCDALPLVPAVNERLKQQFGISHATIQIDSTDCSGSTRDCGQ
ncbi:MAG: cation diffusion facilitator family transporter [Verrucomicrobiae bacterium]|nr:cation diffusion facilitator family transporter [Verrucomicrobiae bacterium]